MYRKLFLIINLLTFSYIGLCQIIPKEGSKINYRLIGFTFPENKQCKEYVLEIAEGKYADEQLFKNNVNKRIVSSNNRITGTVDHFGKEYTWRIIYKKGGPDRQSQLHHFAVGNRPETDTSKIRVRVTTRSEKSKDSYFFVDGTNVMYDDKGLPVWYLPSLSTEQMNGSDMKLTDDGTITFLSNDIGYEIDYDGNILWRSTNKGEQAAYIYHHELLKLHNGHYMALGSARPLSMKDKKKDVSKKAWKRFFNNEQDGKIVELDKKGRVVWEWETYKYFSGSDLQELNKLNDSCRVDFHENAFCINEKDSVIYISFSGISRLVKIKYPSGAVSGTYGNIYNQEHQPGAQLSHKQASAIHTQLADNNLFRNQHSCRFAHKGGLYVYNNNVLPPQLSPDVYVKRSPQIIKLADTPTPDNDAVTWSYNCIPDEEVQNASGGGGNVTELTDGSLYVATNPPYSKLFILSMDKKTEWCAIAEKKNEDNWESMPCYRSSIIENKEAMQRLIWYNADKRAITNNSGQLLNK